MVLFLVASLFRASLHFSTEFDFILILSRALIEEAESLRKVICRSVVFMSVSAVVWRIFLFFSKEIITQVWYYILWYSTQYSKLNRGKLLK